MKIVVCVKQVPDPEAPASSFRIDEATNKVVPPPGIAPVMNGFDGQAMEAALRIKDDAGADVTVLTLGPEGARDVVKKALAMGGDDAVLLSDSAFQDGDAYSTALALAKAIEHIGGVDLVLCGRQASDWDQAQVPQGVAEILGWPCVTMARAVRASAGSVRVERALPDGYEVWEAPLPVVITASNELGEPRYATLKGIMAAGKKPVQSWAPGDVGQEPGGLGASGRRLKLRRLYVPETESKVEFIEGDSPEERAAVLAHKLREAKLI